MDTQAIIETIASAIAPPQDHRTAGENQSLYTEPIDRIFNPYRKAWMKDWLSRQAARLSGRLSASFVELSTVLREAALRYEGIFDIKLDSARRMKAEAHPLADRSKPNVKGYVQWEPVFYICLDASPSGTGSVTLSFEGGIWTLAPDAEELRELLGKIATLPRGCEKAVIRRHYREFLPEGLASLYKTVTVTEGLGRSTFGDGSFTFGHEAVLRLTDGYEMHFGYVAEYLWRPKNLGLIMGTASMCLEFFRRLADKLPGLSVVTNHADDCGTRLTRTLPSGTGAIIERVRRWAGRKKVTEDDVREVMSFYDIESDLSPAEIALEYMKGSAWREIVRKEVELNLRIKENGWVLEDVWDHLKLFVSGQRCWSRELYVAIPYDCPKDGYLAILRERNTLEALRLDLESREDYFTSAGMFPVRPTGRKG